MTTLYEGLCHCRAIGFAYRTSLAPSAWTIRACQCSFCRMHAALSSSDPRGTLEFKEHGAGALQRYRFGQKTADFLLCRECGGYIGATMCSASRSFGIINARILESRMIQLPEAVSMDYENEAPAQRLARRESRWTPIVAGASRF